MLSPKEQLDQFFNRLDNLGKWYCESTSEVPKNLFVNPAIIGKLARLDGFYQRPELAGIVPAHAPLVRYFKLSFGVVLLVDDYEEKFLHFD